MANETLKNVEQTAREALGKLLDNTPSLRPRCIRIAFYDAIKYNPITKADGPNGSIRMLERLEDDKPMKEAIDKLEDLKKSLDPRIGRCLSYADLYQLAGVLAMKRAGGPEIEFQLGRMDSCIPIDSSKIPTISQDSSAYDVRVIFRRLGFIDKEIVALSAAYYYWLNYSGVDDPINIQSYYGKLCEEETRISKSKASSTSNATTTSSTTTERQPSRITAPSTLQYWKCLLSDASFLEHVKHFAKDENDFRSVYATAHKKLSELGFKLFPLPTLIDKEYHDIKHGLAFALAMTVLFGFVGFFYEAMRT